MAISDIDFEGATNQGQSAEVVQKNEDSTNPTVQQEEVTNFSGNDVDDVTGKDKTEPAKDDVKQTDSDDNNTSTGVLNSGDQIEFDGATYTVSENGDLVDDKGKVFKEAKDVKEWLESVNVEDENQNELTLASIQDKLGVTITDENGNAVEFTNDADGVKAYVDSVISLKSNELQEAAVNRVFVDNPLLKQFIDYVQVTGSPRGFGDIPDRSSIKLEKDNEAQLIAVIKMAAQEFGNHSLTDSYIKYLRDGGGLYEEAKNQLEALVEKDRDYRKQIETTAAEQRAQEEQARAEYWENVNNIINKRVIGGYKIPESFTKEIDGKKITVTPNDFFNYVSEAAYETENGNKITAYQRDLNKLTDEEYLNREMLDAWLMFTGGTYKDLIDMAVKENEVRKLVIKSKQTRSNKSVKVVRQQTGKTSIDDIVL